VYRVACDERADARRHLPAASGARPHVFTTKYTSLYHACTIRYASRVNATLSGGGTEVRKQEEGHPADRLSTGAGTSDSLKRGSARSRSNA
jgi:hypothetical protein